MFLTKLKAAMALCLCVGLLGAGAGVLAVLSPAEKPPVRTGETPVPQEAAKEKPPKDQGEKRPRTDRFGDPLPEGAVARLGTVRFRHAGAVKCVAFSQDGKTLASTSNDGTVRRWDAATGRELWRWEGQDLGTRVAFSPDSKYLAAGNRDNHVRLWDRTTGKELRSWPGWFFAFSPDGRAIATADRPGTRDPDIKLWDVHTGKELRRFQGHQGEIYSLAFSPDGKTLASGGLNKTVRLWETATGKELRELRGNDGPVLTITFSPDGRLVASGDGSTTRLRDVTTGKELYRFKHGAMVNCVAFSPDGKTLAAGSEKVRVWDVATGKELYPAIRCQYSAWSVAFSPDGKVLAVGSHYTIRLFEAATGKELLSPQGQDGQLYAVAISPDGGTLATGGFGTAPIRLWDPNSQKEIRRFTVDHYPVVYCLAFSPDGKRLATGGFGGTPRGPEGATLWDVATGKVLRRFQVEKHFVSRLAFSPDGKTLATAQDSICLWNVATGRLLRRFGGHRGAIQSIAFSPNGKLLASGVAETGEQNRRHVRADGGAVRLWDVATGKEKRQFKPHNRGVVCVSFSPDGRLLATVEGYPWLFKAEGRQIVRLWEVATGKRLWRFRGGPGKIQCLSFSPDGRTLAVAESMRAGPSRIHFLEVTTGQPRREFDGHRNWIWSLAFSPDGKTLASASFDTTALVWDVTGQGRKERPGAHALSPDELEALWAALAGTDARKAYQALCDMVAAPRETVPFLKRHLRPVVPADPEQVARLIADLDSERFAVRKRAAEGLEKLGEAAAPALRKTLAGELTLEQRRRLEELLEKAAGPIPSPETLRALRAVEVLAKIATAEAQEVLEGVAKGAPEVRLTQEAKASLKRLDVRPQQ